MIKLITTDIDGTLVKDGSNTLPQEYVEVIGALIDKGIHFVANSGRSMISAERLFGPLKERIYFGACNGALMGTSREFLSAEIVEKPLLLTLLEDIRSIPDVVPFFTGAGIMYSDSDDEELLKWMTEGYQEDITRVPDIAATPEDFVKLSVYDRRLRSGETFRSFCEKWKGVVSTATAGAMWLDVFKRGISKGTAVKWYQNYFGVTPEETMALGDQQNDIPMLQAAVHSYAVGNAIPEVKAACRHVVDSCENGGALSVFKTLL